MKHYRCQQADLEAHARVWDRVCDVLFNGHKQPGLTVAGTGTSAPIAAGARRVACQAGTIDSGQASGTTEILPQPRHSSPPLSIEEADQVDAETYCALYCAEERRAWEDCALVGGCPLERKGEV